MQLKRMSSKAYEISKEEAEKRINQCIEATKEKEYILTPAQCMP